MIHWMHSNIKTTITLLLFAVICIIPAQETLNGDVNKGKDLFNSKCTACHKLDKELVGPALKGVYSRLQNDEGKDLAWFQKWIKNNKAVIASGDVYANKLFEKYKKADMDLFPDFSDQDVIDILSFLENPPEDKPIEKTTAPPVKPSNNNNTIIWVGFLGLIGVLLAILYKVNQLVKLRQNPDLQPEEENKIKNFEDFYAKYENVAKVLLPLLLLLSLYGFWAFLMGIGVDKGYKPEQPIYFSHKIHAGINKIDCQTCHTGAKYGKVAEIPSANVCMNCHKSIQEYKGEYLEPGKDREFYNGQIDALFKHVGFNKETSKYTEETKPIEWVRIHNMPDFVFFNHAQHIVAGEKSIIETHNQLNPNKPIDVVCVACHGEVDTMNVVQMANDFTMNFCIDCHRKTEVDMDNGYNAEYFKNLHSKLAKNKNDSILTVDAIGGLECGKCHY